VQYFSPPISKVSVLNPASSGFYLHGKNYSLVCNFEGYPIDEKSISWTFKPCKNYLECGEEVNIRMAGENREISFS